MHPPWSPFHPSSLDVLLMALFWAGQVVGHIAQNVLPLSSSVPGCLVNSCSIFKTQFSKLIPKDVFAKPPKQSGVLPF